MLNKKFKKAISAVTMFATVISLSGVAALGALTAQAADIADGDIIKSNATNSDGTPTLASLDVYIVKIVGTKKFKRLVLNPEVFNSYGHLKWENIKTVSQAEEDSFTTSSLVRVDGDTKVYALTPSGDTGAKSWVNVTADQFVNQAGSDPDSIYTINGVDAGFYVARTDITTVSQLNAFYADGTLPAETTAGTLAVALSSNTPASASFLRDSTGGATAHAQAAADFLAVNFTAPSTGDVKVTGLKVTRSGISADADLGNAYLYDGDTQIAQNSSFSSKVFTFNDAAGLFTVAAGKTKTINVKADIANGTTTVSGIILSITGADAVTSNATEVSGPFPISGNQMSVATVTDLGYADITNFTTFPATIDPGTTDKELWRFSITANDQDMLVNKIKATVVGTIATADLANFTLKQGTTSLATVGELSASKELVFDLSDSPYKITAGQTKIFVVRGDVVNGSGRAFKFTIRQVGDVSVTDNEYNVAVAPLNTGAAFTLIDANAAGDGTNINNGNLSISLASDSPSGNVAAGATGVTLAKFTYKANGEDIKINTIRVNVNEENSDLDIKNGKLYFNGSQIGSTDTAVADGVTVATTTSQVIAAGAEATIEYKADIVNSATGLALENGQTIVASLVAGTTDATGQSSLANVATSSVTGRTLTVATGALTPAENLTLADATSSLPSGVKSATGVKIGSFVLTAGAGEGASVSQITLSDSVTSLESAGYAGTITAEDLDAVATGKTMTVVSSDKFVVGETYQVSVAGTTTPATIIVRTKPLTTTFTYDVVSAVVPVGGAGVTAATIRSGASTDVDTLADTFQNLRLMQGSTQVGTTISNLTDTAGTSYDFTPSTAIEIAAGKQVVFDVLADVKSNAITQSVNSDATGIITFTLASATGLSTGNSADTTTTPALQNVYIAGVGALSTAVASDTAVTQQVIMGATEVEIGSFKLTESTSSEDLNISQVIVTDTTGNVGSLSNIKLFVKGETTPIATVATLASDGTATFPNLSLVIPKGSNKTLVVKADITGYPGGTSASTHVLSIAAGGITGVGAASGTSLGTSDASTGTAGTMTVYRTKITVAYATDTPSGASSGAADAVVGKFIISNSANAGNYDATVSLVNVAASSSFTNAAAARYIKIYKTNVTAGNLLGTSASYASAVYSDTAIAAGDFVDVTIAAGSSITLIVTADTQAAANPGNFSIGMAATDITWSDGVTASITSVDSLPLTSKTLTY